MKRLVAAAGLLVCALWTGGLARSTTNGPLQEADFAWDRGDYVAALNGYLALLDSPDAAVFEAIALQTGELFKTTELTPDGAAPRFSPDGRYVVYEVGAGVRRITRLVATENPGRTLAELRGTNAAFASDSRRLAYLQLATTPEIDAAQAAVDRAAPAERVQQTANLNALTARATRIVIRDLASGAETPVDTGTTSKTAIAFGAKGAIVFTGAEANGPVQIHSVMPGSAPSALTSDAGDKIIQEVNSAGTALLFTIRPAGGGGRGGGGRGGGAGAAARPFGFLSLLDGKIEMIAGLAPSFSADGRSFVYLRRDGEGSEIVVASIDAPAAGTVARKGAERIDAPALSPDGGRIAFQMMPREDWELYVVNRDGTGERRLTREIQHDLLPKFLNADRVLAAMGEARHRRSHLYDVVTGRRMRLFHNNTVRTIAPEYSWTPSAAGDRVLIVAERDGDTVSPERGVYLVDLSRRITADDLRTRLKSNLAAERSLREKGKRSYAPIAGNVRQVVGEASVPRVYAYEKALFAFDSKHITQPGNKLASAYLFETYKSFGYEPQYQWFAGRGALGGETANVLATLKGTVNPELIYVVSSHYDSVAGGPGADDDSSGTAALLEAARILAKHPQPATIVFASFTGEEAGLLGSREFVRRAVADKLQVVGALNNDMIGWANDHRLDNTIRYSNVGIRDIQHAAAIQFTDLITYDALYYKSTDAAAYYEAWGDIVGGIGSYPVLGNPHYHQPHDVLETINHRLVTEVAKTTAATLMLLASSPSRVKDLKIESYQNGTATLSWTPSPEKGVTAYLVASGPAGTPESQQTRVTRPAATVKAAPGTVISVKALNDKGLEGWDWARVTVR